MDFLEQFEREIDLAMCRDRFRLRRHLRGFGKKGPTGESGAKFEEALRRSVAQRLARLENLPKITYDEELPVCGRREEIAKVIAAHPVVIVCGETGSGKSTQLPKICMELGRGISGMIGHTQPRRIAARSVAARIAEELASPLGKHVGFKVRFAESLSPQSYVKLMTDGILLAESQGDPFLDQYDTIILDEAHERSLNIDFLIGYLKRLLPKRPDLKVIITSATIDAARFAEHFGTREKPAPVIEVSGRTYPVELRYRPLEPDDEGNEPEMLDAVLVAVEEVARIDHGDMLVFMPTERDIHETAKALRGRPIPGDPTGSETEILPLYARLSIAEQQRVFRRGGRRRIVIATNVAESSLTVPGIRFVIDPGTARISRYSPRSKTQRLPIEAVSKASADQRKGRCGRVGPGICVRLYSEEDYLARDDYTAPEIQRTNLAAVILQTKMLRLGDIERFPFLEPPRAEAIRDGYRTLFELGALDDQGELTEIGRRLGRLPVDPRIGRIILAADAENCLHEALIIAAALEVQDPRERPVEKRDAADAAHAQFADEQSDFLGYLKIWDFYHRLKNQVSRSQLQKACRQNFLSMTRLREWFDVHRELAELASEAGLKQRARRDDYDSIHRAILTGLLSSVASRGEGREFSTCGGGKGSAWPGSGLVKALPQWLVAAEIIETQRRYLRVCAKIDPRWIEPLAGHVIKRTYSSPHWERRNASAMAMERVTLFGLPIVSGRPVRYGAIDPEVSRHLLIQHGLVEGDLEQKPEFLQFNERLLDEVEQLQAKLRRRDLLKGDWARFEFYDSRLPADVFDGAKLTRWLRENKQSTPHLLHMSRADLVRDEAADVPAGAFPDALEVDRMELPLTYAFEPGEADDGVNITVPLEAVRQLDARQIEWLVPGLLEEKITAMIRALPKAIRTQFVPAPETARKAIQRLAFGCGDLRVALAEALGQIGGTRVSPSDFQLDRLPDELRMNVCVTDAEGKTVSASRDLDALRRELGVQAAATLASARDPRFSRDGLTAWDFEELPESIESVRGGVAMKAYPMLIDCGDAAALRLSDTPETALRNTRCGLRRLFAIAAGRELKSQASWLPGVEKMRLYAASIADFDLKRQLPDLLAQHALGPRAMARSKPEWEGLLAAARQRIPAAVQDVAGLLLPLFESLHQAAAMLEKYDVTKFRYAADDVRGQLANLVGPDFLTATPWERLKHYPRYFKAICQRLEAMVGNLARDQRQTAEIQARWAAYEKRREEHDSLGIDDEELALYRWMLEEWRVSLFAQKLGSAMPISDKRLDKQWDKVR